MSKGASCFDVAVLGGGPAGLAAALTLRKYSTLSVLVVEKSGYEERRGGEALSPGIHGLLEYLGVWRAFSASGHLPSFGTSAAWGGAGLANRDFILSPLGTGWQLDRSRFDRTLADQAEAAGAEVCRSAKARFERMNRGGWHLSLVHAGKPRSVEAGFLVDGTGQAAVVARQCGVKRCMLDRMVAAGAALETPAVYVENSILVEACPHGWWYSARLPSGLTMVALMSDADLVKRQRLSIPGQWWSLLKHQPHTWDRVGTAPQPARLYVVPAFSARLETAAGHDWIAAGDAAASYDPLSSSGIARALVSGIHAARAIHELVRTGRTESLSEYDRWTCSSFDSYLEARRQYYDLERRWPQSPFWQRRQLSLND